MFNASWSPGLYQAEGVDMRLFVLVVHPEDWGDGSSEVRGVFRSLEAAIAAGAAHGPVEDGGWHVEEFTLDTYSADAPVMYRR